MPIPVGDCQFGEYAIRPSSNTIDKDGAVAQVPARVMDVLAYLIAHRDRVVPADELLDAFWQGRIVEESTIHRHISQIRTALGDSARDSKYIKTISKRGYQAIAPVAGLPAESPSGDEIARMPVPRRRRLAAGLILGAMAILIAIGALILTDAPSRPVSLAELHSIAVLPFAALSDDEQLGFFATGLDDSVLDNLAQFPNLDVAGRTATVEVAARNTSFAATAEALGVAYLLEGTVQDNAGDMRIIAQLIRASDGFHVWSRTYDRSSANSLEVQNEIAAHIAHVVRYKQQGDVRAEHPYLFGDLRDGDEVAVRYLLAAENEYNDYLAGEGGNLGLHVDYIKKAAETDPSLVRAQEELAWAQMRRLDESVDVNEASRLAHAALEASLQAGSRDAPLLLAQIYIFLDLDYERAAALLRKTVEDYPGGRWSHILLALIALREGRGPDVVQLALRGAALDYAEEQPIFLESLAGLLISVGHSRQSLEVVEELLDLVHHGRARSDALLLGALALFHMGRAEEAAAYVEEAWALSGTEAPGRFAYAFGTLGDTARARSILQDNKPGRSDRADFAAGHMALGEVNRAFEYLADGLADHDRSVLNGLRSSPIWDPLRNDSRFASLLQQLREKERWSTPTSTIP